MPRAWHLPRAFHHRLRLRELPVLVLLFLMRADSGNPFSPEECAAIEDVAPHLVEACRVNLALDIYRNPTTGDVGMGR